LREVQGIGIDAVRRQQFSADGDEWDPAELSDTLQNYFADRDPKRSFSASMGLGDRD